MNQAYQARKMRPNEFKTAADLVRRDAAGELCHYAVEHESGHTVRCCSWSFAVAMAEKWNAEALEAA